MQKMAAPAPASANRTGERPREPTEGALDEVSGGVHVAREAGGHLTEVLPGLVLELVDRVTRTAEPALGVVPDSLAGPLGLVLDVLRSLGAEIDKQGEDAR